MQCLGNLETKLQGLANLYPLFRAALSEIDLESGNFKARLDRGGFKVAPALEPAMSFYIQICDAFGSLLGSCDKTPGRLPTMKHRECTGSTFTRT